jgi:hypothetical protein
MIDLHLGIMIGLEILHLDLSGLESRFFDIFLIIFFLNFHLSIFYLLEIEIHFFSFHFYFYKVIMFSFDLIGIGLQNFFLMFLFIILFQFYVHDHEVCKLTGFSFLKKNFSFTPQHRVVSYSK